MHELSIAKALLSEVNRHLGKPAALRRVRRVKVRIGALQAVEPAAIELAWQALRQTSPCDGADLEVKVLPWELHCPECGRWWTSRNRKAVCYCGSERCESAGSDEIVLMAIDLDTPQPPALPLASMQREFHRSTFDSAQSNAGTFPESRTH